jgi:acylphosphatase
MAVARARLHAVVRGLVQGVGFRWFVIRRARVAGLDGWVRNRPDGSVECLVEGPRPALERLLADLREGPPAADVTGVDAEWRPPAGDLEPFDVEV